MGKNSNQALEPRSGKRLSELGSGAPSGKPVRVGFRRINCNYGKIYPPADDRSVWWERLKKAFGTQSSDFVDLALFQIQLATRPYNLAVSEAAINTALAMIEAWQPENAAEAAIALQAACTHAAAMSVLCRTGGASGSDRHVAAMNNAAAKLLTVSLAQAAHLRRMRKGNAQSIRVEHIHIHDGARAVIGDVAS